jgi:type IV pilus assembly protein PilM
MKNVTKTIDTLSSIRKWPSYFALARKEQQQIGCLGMDFGLDALNIVQLKRSAGGHIGLQGSVQIAYDCSRDELLANPRGLRALLARELKRNSILRRPVVTSLPPTDIKIMPIKYAVEGGRSDVAAIIDAVSGRVDGKLEDYVIDYLPIRQQEHNRERMAVVAVAKREKVVNYLEVFRLAGLEVQALDIGPAAIKRLVGAIRPNGDNESILVLNVGSRFSYASMISGRRLLFDEQVRFGEAMLVDQLAEALKLSTEEARAQLYNYGLGGTKYGSRALLPDSISDIAATFAEILKPEFVRLGDSIRRSLAFASMEARGQTVACVFLCGSIARWSGAEYMLKNILDSEVQIIPNPFLDEQAQNYSGQCADLALASGLALRGLQDDI